MGVTVFFACGHTAIISETSLVKPTCACGEHRVRSVKTRAPRFVGACTGPYAEMKALEPMAVSLAEKPPLKLKESD